MPLYMDIHTIDGGVSAEDVEQAHRQDVEEQGAHGVEYKRYWVDERAGKIFCLVEAPERGGGGSRAPEGARSRGRRDLRGV